MKIAIVGTTTSGILGFRAELIQELTRLGHSVYAFSIDYNEKSKNEVIKLGAIPVKYELNRTGMNPLSDIYQTIRLARCLKKHKIEAIFSYFSKPVIFGTFAACLSGIKKRFGMIEGLGYTFTDQPGGISPKIALLRKVQALLFRLSLPLLDKVIFLNKDDPVDLIKKFNIKTDKYEILGPIGLDLRKFKYSKPVRSQNTKFIFIGRILAEKGAREYIEAAKIVRNKYSDVEFIILGGIDEGSLGGIKKSEIDVLANNGIIHYPGHVNNVHEWLKDADVFVLPSYYREGFPRSSQEAMAIGRPIITTDVPGCRETVQEGVNGFLIPKWDVVTLAEKMIWFIENPSQTEVMGLHSRKIAEREFDVNKVNKKLIDMMELC